MRDTGWVPVEMHVGLVRDHHEGDDDDEDHHDAPPIDEADGSLDIDPLVRLVLREETHPWNGRKGTTDVGIEPTQTQNAEARQRPILTPARRLTKT